ncbi:ribonuclease G [Thalassobacter stenotrophicus]|uniref:ribonuclease E/G n=1 Tax=Thalassobacter TaxID=266808 RepID=UPI00051DFD60|nr:MULTISPECIES: ribonuclease E/G [Thalassobacter]KGK80354.1 ribonuclease G [Thalassobacter stenotrophicus]KGL01029.1 ribonuclease G [Thalassobacter sp. 16PALIMAR09]
MKGIVIALDTVAGRPAAARMIDGQLDDLLVDPAGDIALPGTVFRGVCDRPIKGQGGMFMDLGAGRTGFFRQAKGLAPGDTFLVQVTGFAEPGKALPVTDRVLFKSRYCIVTPGAKGFNVARSVRDDDERERLLEIAHETVPIDGGAGLILRSAAEGADADEIAEDLAATWELAQQVLADTGTGPELLLDGPDAHGLAWRDWSTPPEDAIESGPGAFERAGVLDALPKATGAEVRLGEASMFVEPTRALVAVDVNTGGDTAPAAGLRANLAVARALPRALRLRGLGGQIVLDLAPMPKKDRRAFEDALRAAFRADSIETALVGWTPLGHYELQRKRERAPVPTDLEAL